MWTLGSMKNSKIPWKLQTRFDWVCTWGIMKNAASLTPLAPAWAVLMFQHLKVLDSKIPKDLKIWSEIRDNFYGCHTALDTCCCFDALISEQKCDLSEALKQQNYIKIANSDWLSLYMRDNDFFFIFHCKPLPCIKLLYSTCSINWVWAYTRVGVM
jgi:hypothetical protein